MKRNFLRFSAFVLALTSAISANTIDVKDEIDEFLIWGSYYKMKKNGKSVYKNNNPGSSSGSEEGNNNNPYPPISVFIPVVKENGIVKATKSVLGEQLNYLVQNNILSNDLAALWLTDNNTEVVNNKIIESIYSSAGTGNFTVEADNNSVFINNGEVRGTHGGIFSKNGALIYNNNLIENQGDYGVHVETGIVYNNATGIISNIGDYGIYINSKNSEAINEGEIKNTDNYGMFSVNGKLVNTGSGIISNGNDYGMSVKGNDGISVNQGTIENQGHVGMYSGSGASSVNNGIIKNIKNKGMSSEGLNSQIINNGIVENQGLYGFYIFDSARGLNTGTIRNMDNYGMYAEGGSNLINESTGVVENSGDYGIAVLLNATALNSGVVKNHGDYGMYSEGSGSEAANGGLIENTGNNGMYAASGALAVNHTGGVIRNTGNMGMVSNGTNSRVINNGIIENQGLNGIYISNSSEGINIGTIKNTDRYGIQISDNSSLANTGKIQNLGANGIHAVGNSEVLNDSSGIIENTGEYGISLGSNSKALNKGVVKNNGNIGIYAINGGQIINEGIIENTGNYGVSVEVLNTKATNYGIIKNSGNHGMYATKNSEIINETTGIIENQSTHGMVAGSNSKAINKGIIRNNGNNGMYTINSGMLINSGEIRNDGKYGMFITGAGSSGVNEAGGIILNNGDSGLYIYDMGYGINRGRIENNGTNGMHLNNSTGVNEGTIHLTGNNKVGVQVNNNGTFINNGIIQIDGTNAVGIKAMNNSTVKIGQNSQIILNGNSAITQGNTNYSDKQSTGAANSNSGGKAYVIDSTSVLINAGTLSVYGEFTISETGKFILDTETGSINAESINLEGNLYINSEGTANSFENQYTFNNLNTKELKGNGNLISESLLFTSKLEKNTEGKYDVVLSRKQFTEVFEGKFGEILEKNYSESGNKDEKNKIYNSLKINITSKDKAIKAENELTGKSLVSNLAYQEFNRSRILGNSMQELLDKRNLSADTGVYLNIIGNKMNVDTDGDLLGYKDREAGVMLGVMKKKNDKISIGGFLGYLNSDIDYKDEGKSNQKTDTLSLKGALIAKVTDNLKWTSILGYNYGNTETKRKLTYDNSYSELSGNFNSWSAEIDTIAEYTQNINKNINLVPFLGINTTYIHQDSYKESGRNTYNLNIDSASGTSVRAKTGMKIDLSVYNNKNINFKLIPSIFYSYELGKPYKNRNVELETFKDVILVDSRKIERNNMDLGIGMEYNYRDELTFYTQYSREVLNAADNDSIKVGFKINF